MWGIRGMCDARQTSFFESLFFVSIAVVVGGCSHSPVVRHSDADPEISYQQSQNDPHSLSDLNASSLGGPQVFRLEKGTVVGGVEIQHLEYDFPVRVNSQVEKWVNYFTGRGRKSFTKYLRRSEYFIPYIQPILTEFGLPLDLVYLAMIESGFNNHARSRARAVGPWQFISSTGRRFGLDVNWWVDERRNIKKSTIAAAHYLGTLYRHFNNWELAAASYNAGEHKVVRAIRRYGVKDFWVISKHRFLRPETRNYVPKIIAAAILSKNREAFGFPPKQAKVLGPGESLAEDGSIVQLHPEQTEATSDAVVSAHSAIENSLNDPPEPVRETPPPARWLKEYSENERFARPHVNRKGVVGGERLAHFEVDSPADLFKIADAAGVDYQVVKKLNPEIKRWCTPFDRKTYQIHLPASAKDDFLAKYNHPAFETRVKFRRYKVRRGDTLSRIARRFGIYVAPLKDMNGIRSSRSLRQGKTILLPIPSDRYRSLASLDLHDYRKRRYRRRASKRRVPMVSMAQRRHPKVSLSHRKKARSRQLTDQTSRSQSSTQ